MKRKFLVVLLAIACVVCCAVAIFMLGGCNNSGGTISPNPNGSISGGDESCEHQWGSWSTVSEATCTEKGKQERFCSVCGGKETKEIPALGHSFNTNNTCTRCGYELTPTVGLEYELITDKNNSYYAVTGLGNADAKEIVIPAYHAGKAVKKIADEAFYGSDYITSVYLSGTINEIGKGAFYWCENLSELTISKPTGYSLIINEQAFYGCAKLKNISLPDNVTEIFSDSFAYTGYYNDKNNWQNGVLMLCGWVLSTDNTASAELTLDSLAKGIANNALSNSNVTKIIIETSISCNEKSFANSRITSVTAPNKTIINYLNKTQITELNITSGNLREGDLYGFGYLQKLTVPSLISGSGQVHYLFGQTQYEGAIEVKRGYYRGGYKIETTPYYLPSNLREVTILRGNIVSYAFSEINSITKINIGNNVNSLGDNICYHCNEQVVVNFANETEFLSTTKTASSYVISGPVSNYKYTKLTIDNKDIVDFKIPDGTTNIKECAFKNCAELKEVTIPSSVTSIGEDAFYGCSNLTSIIIPDGVTSIGSGAFIDCTSLTSIKIPDRVTSIGSYAFSGCTSLESINVPDGVTSIGEYAFYGCSNLTSITIPDSVTSIGYKAFSGCTSLGSVNFGDNSSLTSIGGGAFSGCTKLIQKQGEVQYVDKWVIDCNTSVTTVDLRTDTRGIADYAFSDCTSLTSITIPDSVTSIGYKAFSGCTSLESVNFGNSSKLTSIGDSVFNNCTSLESITIPDGVTSIGEDAFYNCTSLNSVTFGNNSKLETIGSWAFEGCTNLTSITIPDSVTSIGWSAFRGCTSLTSVTFENSNDWKVSKNSDMSNASDVTLGTPEQNANYLKNTYYSYYWKRES